MPTPFPVVLLRFVVVVSCFLPAADRDSPEDRRERQRETVGRTDRQEAGLSGRCADCCRSTECYRCPLRRYRFIADFAAPPSTATVERVVNNVNCKGK